MNTINDKIRASLVEARKAKKLSQTDVGLIVRKGKTTVASWEQGLSLPDHETLYILAKFYGKTIAWMYGERER